MPKEAKHVNRSRVAALLLAAVAVIPVGCSNGEETTSSVASIADVEMASAPQPTSIPTTAPIPLPEPTNAPETEEATNPPITINQPDTAPTPNLEPNSPELAEVANDSEVATEEANPEPPPTSLADNTVQVPPEAGTAGSLDRPGTGVSTFDELPERLQRSLTAAATTLGVQVADLYEAITTHGRSNDAAIAAALGVNESDLIAALPSPNRG